MGGSSSKEDDSANSKGEKRQPAKPAVTAPPLEITNIIPTDKIIASGSFATVYDGFIQIEDESDELCAIKVFKKEANLKLEKHMEEASLAFQVSAKNHPNIVNVKGIWRGHPSQQLAIVMERCTASLFEYIASSKKSVGGGREASPIPTPEKRSILIDVCRGMIYLVEQNVFHGDLTTKNILLIWFDGRVIAKITDFGLSKVVDGSKLRSSLNHGTDDFMPPEMLKKNNPARGALDATILSSGGEQIDVFSYGCCAVHLSSGEYPTPGPVVRTSPTEGRHEALDEFGRRGDHIRKIPPSESPLFRPLIKKCLSNQPDCRGTFSQILEKLEEHGDDKQSYHMKTVECEKLRTELKEREDEQKHLKSKMEQKEDTISKMKELYDQECTELRSRLQKQDEEQQRSNVSLKTEQDERQAAQMKVSELEGQVLDLSKQLSEKTKKEQELQGQISGMHSSVSSVGSLLDKWQNLQQEKALVDSELKAEKESHSKVIDKLKDCSAKLEKTENELDGTKSELESVSEQLTSSKRACKEWREKHEEVQGNYSQAYNDLMKWQKWKETTYIKEKTESKQLQDSNKQLQENIEHLEAKVREYQESQADMTVKLNKATAGNKTKDQELASLREEQRQVVKEKSVLEAKLTHLQKELDNSKRSEEERKVEAKQQEREKNIALSQLSEAREFLATERANRTHTEGELVKEKEHSKHLQEEVDMLNKKCNEMAEHIAALKATNEQKNGQIDSLNKALQDARQRTGNHSKDKSSWQTEKKKLENDVSKIKKEAEKLQKDMKKLKEERDTFKNTLVVREKDLKSSQEERAKIQKDKTLLEKAIEDKEGVIEAMKKLEGTIQKLKEENSVQKHELTTASEERDEYKGLYETTDAELKNASDQLESYKEEKTTMKGEVQQLEEQLTHMTSNYKLSSTECTRLQSELEELKKENARKLKDVQAKKDKMMEDLKTKLDVANKEKDDEVESSLKVASQAQQDRDDLKKEYEALLRQHEQHATELRGKRHLKVEKQAVEEEKKKIELSLEETKSKFNEYVQRAKCQESELQGKIQEMEADLHHKDKLLTKQREELGDFEDTKMDQQIKLKEAEDLVQEKDKQMSSLRTELQNLTQKHGALSKELNNVRKDNSRLRDTVTKRDDQIQTMRGEQDSRTYLAKRLEDKEEEVDKLTENLKQIDEERRKLSDQCGVLTIDNAAIKNKLEMLSSAFDENQVKKKQLQKQLDDTLDDLKLAITSAAKDSSATDIYKAKIDAKESLLANHKDLVQYLKDKVHDLEVECQRCKSNWVACSSNIVSVQLHFYFFGQLTRVFNSSSVSEFDKTCLRRGSELPSCVANVQPFDEKWKKRVSPLHIAKDSVENFLKSLVISSGQNNPIQGQFCILDFHSGHPQLNLFVVNSCPPILADAASLPSVSSTHFIQVTLSLEPDWWKKCKLQVDREGILFEPIGVFPSQCNKFDPLPPALDPIINWILSRILQSLKSKIDCVSSLLYRDQVSIPMSPLQHL